MQLITEPRLGQFYYGWMIVGVGLMSMAFWLGCLCQPAIVALCQASGPSKGTPCMGIRCEGDDGSELERLA